MRSRQSLACERMAKPGGLRHQYTTIPKGSTRLLHFLPVRDENALRITLSEHTFDEACAHEYVAISYAWGDSTCCCRVEVGDRFCMIPQSAYDALAALRETDPDQAFWMDSVCINQADAKEKSEQVQQMHSVYSRAALVIVWLGKAVSDTAHAFNYFRRYQTVVIPVYGTNWPGHDATVELLESGIIPMPTEAAIQSLTELCKAPWFRRLWAVQEIALARTARLQSGKYFCSYSTAIAAIAAVAHMGVIIGNETKVLSASMIDFTRCVQPALKCLFFGEISSDRDLQGSLAYLAIILNDCCTSDPRDYVYGMVGLMGNSQEGHLRLNVDYLAHKHQVWQRATIWAMRREGTLDALSLAATRFLREPGQRPREQTYASWAIDFYNVSEYDIRQHKMASRMFKNFKEALESHTTPELEELTDTENSNFDTTPTKDRSVSVRGTIVDAPIAALGTGAQERERANHQAKKVLEATQFDYREAENILSIKGAVVDILAEAQECYQALDVDNGTLSSNSGYILCPRVYNDLTRELNGTVARATACVMASIKAPTEESGRGEAESQIKKLRRERLTPDDPTWVPPTLRKLGRTERGHYGIVQWNAQIGDKFCILPTADYPFVIRPVNHRGKPCYELICETYTPALMEIEIDTGQREWITLC